MGTRTSTTYPRRYPSRWDPSRRKRSNAVMAKASPLTLRQCFHAYLDDLQIWGHRPKTTHAYTKNVLATFENWAET